MFRTNRFSIGKNILSCNINQLFDFLLRMSTCNPQRFHSRVRKICTKPSSLDKKTIRVNRRNLSSKTVFLTSTKKNGLNLHWMNRLGATTLRFRQNVCVIDLRSKIKLLRWSRQALRQVNTITKSTVRTANPPYSMWVIINNYHLENVEFLIEYCVAPRTLLI